MMRTIPVATRLLVALVVAWLAGCATQPSPEAGNGTWQNVYTQSRDSGPAAVPAGSAGEIPDAVPRDEPRAKYGNKSPYTVLGKTYRVLDDAHGYREEGDASWYGNKFHGFRTSSLETYDMHAMTAAHCTLPIPSYVRVTNLANGRSVVVKVNDRGPFHEGRIIDLSWAAARKLGYADKGTARVRVETVFAEPRDAPPENETATATIPAAVPASPAEVPTPTPTPPATPWFVQLGAFRARATAEQFAAQAGLAVDGPVRVTSGDDGLHRVRIGPYEDRPDAERMRTLLGFAGLGTPSLVAGTPAH